MAGTALRRTKRFFWISFKVGLYTALLGLIALIVAVSVAVGQLPSYEELSRRDDLGQMIRVRAADGAVIHQMGPSFGEWLPYNRIPATMRQTMIAVEDRRFEYHWGVDPIGIVRSFWVRLTTGHWRQGGSTITQQLARNIFLNNSRTFGRKIREAILAMALEWRFSKDQIMELYLNRVYFGGGAYGVDAASRRFYGHSATDLSLGEAAIIAGLVKAPSNYSPTADIQAARGRAGVVLSLMREQGQISATEASSANPQSVTLVETTERRNSTRYFTDWVLPQLDVLVDQEVHEPIEVWTTIDLGLQNAAERSIAAHVPAGAQGALVSLDRDGAVRAMVGGLDYVTSSYNRATQATRQPGSSFKLFVYLAALESGYGPDSQVDTSAITVNGYTPRGGAGSGTVSLRQAFALSNNTVAVRLAQEVSTRTVANMARRLGVTTPIDTNPAMALGSSETRLIDMTRAYASVARGGLAVAPYGVRRVTTAGGTLLYEHHDDDSRTLVSPQVAAQMTDLMQSVVANGTGRAAGLGRPTAGKTGTTTSNKDGWFVGFSSGLTTGVWYGRDDNRVLPGLTGGTAPAQAFHDYMAIAVANRPVEEFAAPVATPDWQVGDNSLQLEIPDEGVEMDPNAMPTEPIDTPPPELDDPGQGGLPPSGVDEQDPDQLEDIAPAPPRQQPRPVPQNKRGKAALAALPVHEDRLRR